MRSEDFNKLTLSRYELRLCAREECSLPPFLGSTLRGAFGQDRKSTRLNSSHLGISYAVFCLKKKKLRIGFTQYRPKRRHVAQEAHAYTRQLEGVAYDLCRGRLRLRPVVILYRHRLRHAHIR